jgi:hypothetical protein
MKKTIALDVDATLAHYTKWEGIELIGDPLPGAKEFVERLRQHAEILIYTTRGNAEMNGRHGWGPTILRKLIAEWLEKHGIPYDDIWIGQGKPIFSAIIDDRAVSCRPMEDPTAYEKAFAATMKLIGIPVG